MYLTTRHVASCDWQMCVSGPCKDTFLLIMW